MFEGDFKPHPSTWAPVCILEVVSSVPVPHCWAFQLTSSPLSSLSILQSSVSSQPDPAPLSSPSPFSYPVPFSCLPPVNILVLPLSWVEAFSLWPSLNFLNSVGYIMGILYFWLMSHLSMSIYHTCLLGLGYFTEHGIF